MSISEQSTMYPSQSVEWLKRLIAFDTVSRHSNLALIEEVQAYCISLGLEPVLTFNDTTDTEHSSNKANQSKANLFVSVPAGGG